MSPGIRPSPSLLSNGHNNPTRISTRPIAISHRTIDLDHPLASRLPRLGLNGDLPAPFSEFELEREEFEQVTKREHAAELATAHHEEWTSPGALHLRQRLQSVGFGCHDVIRRTWLHGL